MPDARRKEREAARRAAEKAAAEAWRAKVDAHFGYLRTTYGFRITSVDASSAWVTRLVYQSDVAAVAVDRSFEFGRVEVSVIRLVDGKLPEYPVFILPETVINQTLLDNILIIRNSDRFNQLCELKGLEDDEIEKTLAFLARALEEHSTDFLSGDFSIFVEVDQLIRDRVKAHPPVITVYLPESASAEEEAAAIEETRRGSPGVQVVARRYPLPTPRKRKNAANDGDKQT